MLSCSSSAAFLSSVFHAVPESPLSGVFSLASLWHEQPCAPSLSSRMTRSFPLLVSWPLQNCRRCCSRGRAGGEPVPPQGELSGIGTQRAAEGRCFAGGGHRGEARGLVSPWPLTSTCLGALVLYHRGEVRPVSRVCLGVLWGEPVPVDTLSKPKPQVKGGHVSKL